VTKEAKVRTEKIRRPPTWLTLWAVGAGLPEDADGIDVWFLACERLGFDVNLLGAAGQRAVERIAQHAQELAAQRELEEAGDAN
jgi:hypothetical protein